MPLQKTSNSDLVRIDLPAPGEWVEVKRVLGRDDERAISARLLRGQMVTRPGEPMEAFDAGVLYENAIFSTFAVAIKRWSFDEPVTLENIRALDDASVQAISDWMKVHYRGPRAEDDAKNSGGPGLTPSSAAGQYPENSAGSP